MDLDKKTIIKLEYITVAIIFVAACLFDFLPQIGKTVKFSRKIRENKATVKSISQAEINRQTSSLAAQKGKLMGDLDLVYDAVEEIQNKILKEQNIGLVTLEIEKLASHAQIDLGTIRPMATKSDTHYDSQLIEIGFHGSYDQLIKFLSQIELSDTYMAVQEMSIDRKEALYPKLEVRLVLSVLYVAPKNEEESASPNDGLSRGDTIRLGDARIL